MFGGNKPTFGSGGSAFNSSGGFGSGFGQGDRSEFLSIYSCKFMDNKTENVLTLGKKYPLFSQNDTLFTFF